MFVKIVTIGGEKTIQCESYEVTRFPVTDEKPAYIVIETHPLKGAFSFAESDDVRIFIMNDEGTTIDRHYSQKARSNR